MTNTTIDLRADYDALAPVSYGVIYRKGNIVQAWWSDPEGRQDDISETWVNPDVMQAIREFDSLVERFS
jgi:hypothetical protein